MNKYSSRVTQPRSQGASQAMLYGIGLTDADLQKPQVGICSMWYEGNTCNMHLDRLAAHVKEGVQAAGLVGLRFNTIGVSDGLSMGTDGMSYSLPSRDLIADSIETVDGRAVVRRADHRARLRQEHAGQRHRDGASQPAVADGLRRNDSRRLRAGQAARHHLGVSVVRRISGRRRSPTNSGSTSCVMPARAPVRAAACTRPTRWPWRSRRSGCRCRTVRRFRPRIRARPTSAVAPARRCARCSNATSSRATS